MRGVLFNHCDNCNVNIDSGNVVNGGCHDDKGENEKSDRNLEGTTGRWLPVVVVSGEGYVTLWSICTSSHHKH